MKISLWFHLKSLAAHALWDHRPSVGKLDPRAINCIFVGYSSAQKGYKCWSPNERRLFVSMDVTFRESVPFYGNKTDLNFMFEFGPTKSNEVSREGENDVRLSDPVEQNLKKMEAVISGSNPPVRMKAVTNDLNPNPGHGDSPVVDPPYKGSLKVYVRRKPDLRKRIQQLLLKILYQLR